MTLTLIVKNVIILFLLTLINYAAFAQRNFYKLNFGLGAGVTRAYTDYDQIEIGFAENALLDYYLTPYSSFGLEVQKGMLKGGENPQLKFENQYLAVFGNGKVHFGEFLPFSYSQTSLEKILQGVYIGAGLGLIKNEFSKLNKALPTSKEIVAPLNVGIDFYLLDRAGENRFSINLNVQTVLALGDNLDGEFTRANDTNDWYQFFSVGLRYSFGFKGYYGKGWLR